MDSIYQALFSSSQILIDQIGRAAVSEEVGFGPFWVLMDGLKTVRAGDKDKLYDVLEDMEQIGRLTAQVDDGFEPAILGVDGAVVAAGQLCTERSHCGYMFLVLPGYSLDTAEANADLIELLMSQMNIIASLIEKNNQLHQGQLTRMAQKSPVLSATRYI